MTPAKGDNGSQGIALTAREVPGVISSTSGWKQREPADSLLSQKSGALGMKSRIKRADSAKEK